MADQYGILKVEQSNQWDEDNLIYNDSQKHLYGNMIVDEPKTPFHYEIPAEDGMEEQIDEIAHQNAEINQRIAQETMKDDEQEKDDENDEESFNSALAKKLEAAGKKTARIAEPSHDESDSHVKSSFEEKRKKHYDEFIRVKEIKEKGDDTMTSE